MTAKTDSERRKSRLLRETVSDAVTARNESQRTKDDEISAPVLRVKIAKTNVVIRTKRKLRNGVVNGSETSVEAKHVMRKRRGARNDEKNDELIQEARE